MGLPSIGPLELIIVLAIALLIVGPGRLPEMGNAVGRTIREFRKASSDMTDSVKLDPEAEAAKDVSTSAAATTQTAPAAVPAAAAAAPAAATLTTAAAPDPVAADVGASPSSDATQTDVDEETKADVAEQA